VKSVCFEQDGVGIGLRLARDLTKDHVITLEIRQYQRRPPLRLAEVGKGEVEDYDIALYKLAQAASSSGVSQSLASADSAASFGTAATAPDPPADTPEVMTLILIGSGLMMLRALRRLRPAA
jgi:hypothetical protein